MTTAAPAAATKAARAANDHRRTHDGAPAVRGRDRVDRRTRVTHGRPRAADGRHRGPAPPDDGDDPRPQRRPRRHARPGAPRVTTIDRLRHPSISEAGTRAAGIDPEPIPSGGVTRWTAQARQDRVPRRAADLMDKRARPRSKRPRPRSGRGVRCTRHPCRQASLRMSPRRGAGRPHPPAMGALSVIQRLSWK